MSYYDGYTRPETLKALFMRDTGYTKLCPRCGKRYGLDKSQLNQSRDIEMIRCEVCKEIKDKRIC